MRSSLRSLWPWFVGAAVIAACDDFEEGSSPSRDAGADAGTGGDSGVIADAAPADDRNAPPGVDAGPCASCRSGQCYEDAGCFPVVFVTTLKYTGDFGADGGTPAGLALADRICDEAGNVGLASDPRPRGKFKAWLSTSTESAILRVTNGYPLGAKRPVVDTAGAPLARSYNDLVKPSQDGGGLLAGILLSEQGGTVAADEIVWTGTTPEGAKSDKASLQCKDWTLADASTGAVVGRTGATDGRWTQADERQCQFTAHLYCFETVP